ncbi:Poly [ADP-ribose] polymerase 2 [Actinomortierella ambigua]|nr:Poly [ADP-ribose] polymerase 2 [Actinomortierella ambigua]
MPPKKAAKPIFEDCVFAFSGTYAVASQVSLKEAVTAPMAGATVSQTVTGRTTHLVTSQADYDKDSTKVQKAKQLNIHIVNDDFVTDSINKKKRLKESAYAFDKNATAAALPTPVTTAPTTPAAAAAATAATASASPSPTVAAPAPAKGRAKRKTTTKDADDDDNDDNDGGDSKAATKAKKIKVEDKKKVVASSSSKTVKRPPTSVRSGMSLSHLVYVDDDVAWNARLNQTEIGLNNNKYYMIQLLTKPNNGGDYIVFTHWGRVGEHGKMALDQFGSDLSSAKRHFEKKFRDKSSNAWADRDNFVKKAGKYLLLPPEDPEEEEEEKKEKVADKGKAVKKEVVIPDSQLHPKVQDLVGMIFNTNMMLQQMKELDYDAEKMPLGKLAKATINQGYGVLKKIAEEMEGKDATQYNRQRLASLSSEFYTVIPHSFGRRLPPVIITPEMLKRKLEMLESLTEIEEAQKIMKENKKVEEEMTENPLDIQFRSLKLNKLEPMDRTSERFKIIEQFTKNSHGKTHGMYGLEVMELFDLDREGEHDRFTSTGFHKDENRRLLWHGSRMTNYVGILSQGLRIAPPSAPVTGYMFGKGVYFADCVSKSANYCFTNRRDNVGLMLLCEVALGDQLELTNSDYYADQKCREQNKHSTKGLGRTIPDPEGDIEIDSGVTLQLGKLVDTQVPNAYLQYNEMIVYDVSQIRMRYLVKMKFNY